MRGNASKRPHRAGEDSDAPPVHDQRDRSSVRAEHGHGRPRPQQSGPCAGEHGSRDTAGHRGPGPAAEPGPHRGPYLHDRHRDGVLLKATPDLPEATAAVGRPASAGIPVVTFVTDLPGSARGVCRDRQPRRRNHRRVPRRPVARRPARPCATHVREGSDELAAAGGEVFMAPSLSPTTDNASSDLRSNVLGASLRTGGSTSPSRAVAPGRRPCRRPGGDVAWLARATVDPMVA